MPILFLLYHLVANISTAFRFKENCENKMLAFANKLCYAFEVFAKASISRLEVHIEWSSMPASAET